LHYIIIPVLFAHVRLMHFDWMVALPVCILRQVYTLMIPLAWTTLVSNVFDMATAWLIVCYIYTFKRKNCLQFFFSNQHKYKLFSLFIYCCWYLKLKLLTFLLDYITLKPYSYALLTVCVKCTSSTWWCTVWGNRSPYYLKPLLVGIIRIKR